MAHAATHHSIETIKRSAAQSATARIAYICRTDVLDERTGERHRYRDEGDLSAIQMIGFDGSPAEFANSLEAAEKRKDAQVGRSTILALPNELDAVASAKVVRAYQEQLRERYGCASVSAIHRKAGNNHAHIVESTRDASGQKIDCLSRSTKAKAEAEHRRQAWAGLVNEELERVAPKAKKVDHRSLDRRAADGDEEAASRVSVPHLGPARHAALKAKEKRAQTPSWAQRRIKEARDMARAFTELRAAEKALKRLEKIREAAQRKLAERRPRSRDRGLEM
jgi:hypothetical protein